MATFLHTMVRVTDPERSRAFYEALSFRFSRDMDIIRNGELEATNYFFSLGDDENVLELTYNHDGRTYDLGTGYGHIAIGVGVSWRAAEVLDPGRPQKSSPLAFAASCPLGTRSSLLSATARSGTGSA
jgi:catechol 2,3-dioxygenase-like lactoylglutathione lyase family enzyme